MHEPYYVIAFDYFLLDRLGIGQEIKSDVRGRGGSYELPPSRGWPCLVENKLFLKTREAHSSLYHHCKCHHCCHISIMHSNEALIKYM